MAMANGSYLSLIWTKARLVAEWPGYLFRESAGCGTAWSVDLTYRNLRRLITPTDASDPAWSPLLDRFGQKPAILAEL